MLKRFITKYKRMNICIIAFFTVLAGCASILDSTKANLSVRSEPNDAKIIILDNDGTEVYYGTTPADILLPKSVGYFSGADYLITLSKPGYQSRSITVTRSISGWYWGNILLGGLIGMLIVDPATGAMWTLDEKLPVVNLPKLAGEANDASNRKMKLQIMTIDELQMDTKTKLIPLESNND